MSEDQEMTEWLRRIWRELWYDPVVEYRRAKDLLAKRLVWSDDEAQKRRRSKLRLWRSDHKADDH
jgi:hypothetical protein